MHSHADIVQPAAGETTANIIFYVILFAMHLLAERITASLIIAFRAFLTRLSHSSCIHHSTATISIISFPIWMWISYAKCKMSKLSITAFSIGILHDTIPFCLCASRNTADMDSSFCNFVFNWMKSFSFCVSDTMPNALARNGNYDNYKLTFALLNNKCTVLFIYYGWSIVYRCAQLIIYTDRWVI